MRYVADVVADFGAGNLEDFCRVPGRERTKEVTLPPVGCSTILLRRDGARGVTYDRLVPVPVGRLERLELEDELVGVPGDPPTWLSPSMLPESGPRNARRGKAVVPSSLGVPTLDMLGAGEDSMEPYSSTVEESSAACRCRSCSFTLDKE